MSKPTEGESPKVSLVVADVDARQPGERAVAQALAEMVSIGDGSSIAMGNAAPKAQNSARYVTTSNDEDGLANAIEPFVLGNA
jgi:hypothetical protein